MFYFGSFEAELIGEMLHVIDRVFYAQILAIILVQKIKETFLAKKQLIVMVLLSFIIGIVFEKIQEKLQHEEGTYMETRYNTIIKFLENITDDNQDFTDLIAFVSLVGSQYIPRSLLDNYKNNTTVDDFIFYLKKYLFITNESSSVLGPTFSIHTDTHTIMFTYIKQKLNLSTNKEFLSQIANLLESYIYILLDREDYSRFSVLSEHIETFLNHDILTDEIIGSIGAMLGGIYCNLELYNKKTEQLLESSIAILKKHINASIKTKDLKNIYLKIARAKTCLGEMYGELGYYNKANDCLKESFKLYQKYEKNHISIAITLRYLGVLNRNIGNYSLAKDYLNKSIEIFKKNDDDINVAFSTIYLGTVYIELGDYRQARELIEQAISCYKNNNLKDDMNITWGLSRIAVIDSILGNYTQAKDTLEESLFKYNKYYGANNHPHVAWVMMYLGNVYRELKDYNEAKKILTDSLAIHKKYCLQDSIDIGTNLLYLGQFYTDLEKYEQAKHNLEQSLTIYKKHYGNDHIQTAKVLNALGENCLLGGKLEVAETLLNQAKNILELQQHLEIITSLEFLGDLYSKKVIIAKNSNNIKQSMKYRIQSINYYKQGLKIAKTGLPPNSVHIVKFNQKIKVLDT